MSLLSASAGSLAGQNGNGADVVVPPGQWSELHTPAVNVQATKSHAAGTAGVCHVCQWLTVALANDGTGSAQTVVQFNLRDGATGAGTILWSVSLALPATAGDSRVVHVNGLNLMGTAATAMTLECSAQTATHTAASVAFGGYSIR